jgi:hypothetical protein
MTPAGAQRHAALWRDGLVSPAGVVPLVERLRDFVGPSQHAVATEASQRPGPLSLQGRRSHGPRQHAEDSAPWVDVERLGLHACIGTAPWAQRPWSTVWVGQGVAHVGAPEGRSACEPRRFPQRGKQAGGGTRPGGGPRGQGDPWQGGVSMASGTQRAPAGLDCR